MRSTQKLSVEVDVPGRRSSRAVWKWPSLIVHTVSVDVKQHWTLTVVVQELCESRGGRPWLPVPFGFCGRKATLNFNCRSSKFKSCVKVEVDTLGSPPLKVRTVSVDVKQHLKMKKKKKKITARSSLRERRMGGLEGDKDNPSKTPSTGLRHPSFNHCRI